MNTQRGEDESEDTIDQQSDRSPVVSFLSSLFVIYESP